MNVSLRLLLKDNALLEPVLGCLINTANKRNLFEQTYSNSDLFEHYNTIVEEFYASNGKSESLADVSTLMKNCFTKLEELPEELQKAVNALINGIERIVARCQLENLEAQFLLQTNEDAESSIDVFVEGETSVDLDQVNLQATKKAPFENGTNTGLANITSEANSINPDTNDVEYMDAEFLTEQFLFFLRKAEQDEIPEFKNLSIRLMGLSDEEHQMLKDSLYASMELLQFATNYSEMPTLSGVKELFYNEERGAQILLSDYMMAAFEVHASVPGETLNNLTGMLHLQKHFVDLAQAESPRNAKPLPRESHLLLALGDIATWLEVNGDVNEK